MASYSSAFLDAESYNFLRALCVSGRMAASRCLQKAAEASQSDAEVERSSPMALHDGGQESRIPIHHRGRTTVSDTTSDGLPLSVTSRSGMVHALSYNPQVMSGE